MCVYTYAHTPVCVKLGQGGRESFIHRIPTVASVLRGFLTRWLIYRFFTRTESVLGEKLTNRDRLSNTVIVLVLQQMGTFQSMH